MFRHIMIFGLTLTIVGAFVGCSEEEAVVESAQGWDDDEKLLREKLYRGGTVIRALAHYQMAIGSFPTTKQGLRALLERPDGLRDPSHWSGPYLDSEDQLIDPWGNEFKYVFPGATHEGKFDIFSFGPDGQEGTEDDYINWDLR